MIVICIVAFHLVAVSLGLGILLGAVPAPLVGDMMAYLHKSIGITVPTREQVRMAALIWIGSAIVVVDGILVFLVFITSMAVAR
jgi:hypothetical protein